ILANGALLAGHCTVEDGAFLSGNCAIHQYTRIGRLAMISGGATTTKDVPPFFMAQGPNPGGGVHLTRPRPAGLSHPPIDALREAYRILYMQRQVLTAALEQVERDLGHVDVVAELLAFVRASKRGITSYGGYGHAA